MIGAGSGDGFGTGDGLRMSVMLLGDAVLGDAVLVEVS